jgi:hypothetical protein
VIIATALRGLFLILAIVGAVYDYKYVSKGGDGPTRTEKTYLIIGITLILIGVAGLAMLGGDPEALGRATAYLAIVVFFYGRYVASLFAGPIQSHRRKTHKILRATRKPNTTYFLTVGY